MFAVVAGTGALPGIVVNKLLARGESVLICEVAGVVPDLPAGLPRLAFGLETLGTFLETLPRMGVAHVCLAGAVRRPRLDPTRLDAATMPLVPRMMAAMGKGDDGALRELLALIEERGMAVVAAADLAPDLLPPSGVLTVRQPDERQTADARRGETEIAAMGRADVGQACVVLSGQIIAREDVTGTDAMLARLSSRPPVAQDDADPFFAPLDGMGDLIGAAADWLSGPGGQAALPGHNAILFKAPKPTQDRRVDLPVIGPETAMAAQKAGLAGIVIEAGGVMVLDLAATVDALEAKGLFLWVRPAGS
jgi:UDP-2,3-diacylglucosamine hydrolase